MTTSAGLTFLSWVRTGLVSAVRAPAGAVGSMLDAGLPAAASLPVTLAVDGGGTGTFEANLVGPGDVVGLDPQQVIRSDPAPGASGVAPNYFAFVELDRPDLPWMLTPAAPAAASPGPGARRGLRPWLCLVVVPDRPLEPPTASRPLPRLSALDAELPDLETAWLWAHAQVLTTAGEDLSKVLSDAPDRTLSRLVAPRRLEAGTAYLACVVPAFDAGRRAGLGLSPANAGPLAPAWTRGATPRGVELPVYHAWRFSTAREKGDFEQLARRIQAMRFGESGVRTLDVGHAGSALPGPAAGEAPWTVDLEGAIVGDEIVPGAWAGRGAQALPEAIALRLASSAAELAPPTYGALQAGYAGSLASGQGPAWLRSLNLDPRYRATASLGTRLVQRYQEALVASAWEQTAAIREANRLLRQAQLARAVGEIVERRLKAPAALGTGRFLQLTAPIHRQVAAAAGGTVASALARNAAARSSVSVAFRRVARPAGPVARRLAPALLTSPLARLGLPASDPSAVRPTPQLKAVSGTFDLGQASAQGSNESLATLTRARVLTPIFPWEAAAPTGAPAKVPFAYLSDLVVATRRAGTWSSSAGDWVTSVGRALDFDGVPQLGWSRLGSDAPRVGSYLDRGGVQGRLTAGTWAQGSTFRTVLYWRPGFLFDPPGLEITGDEVSGIPEAIAFADVHGTGAIDLVFLHQTSRKVPAGASPGSVWFDDVFDTYLKVGFDFDPATATVRGGWTEPMYLGRDSPTPVLGTLAAAGSRVFVVVGTTLRVIELGLVATDWVPTGTGSYRPIERWSMASDVGVDLRPYLPGDFQTGAVVASDFGGMTGADLLVFFVAGEGSAMRAGYRIAYDVEKTGAIGRWGVLQPAPIPVGGTGVAVTLGVTSAASDQLRTEKTSAFREAAAETQARQERIVAASGPPPAAPAVDVGQLAGEVGAAVDPASRVEEGVAARLALAAPIDPATVTDPLQPLALTPRFPYPTYELLRDSFQERLYPGASRLPDDSATVLVVDRPALESFLVGLNHELSRELLWRGFPLRHGTYFSRFWDAGRDDITAIEKWAAATALGAHAPAGVAQPSLLLVVRAELLRRVPNAIIYAAPAMPGENGGRTPDLSVRRAPLFGGRLLPDIRFFAFDLRPTDARGVGVTDGWYFVFQEHPTAPRFGLDEGDGGYGTRPPTWAELQWPQVAASEEALRATVHVDAGPGSPLANVMLPDGGSSALSHQWGFSAAHMAHITLQRPALVAIHGSDLIAPEVP